MKDVTKQLLGIEESARKYFEQFPFVQALLAGVGVIIFWRGIWEWLDISQVSPFTSIVLGALILGGVGVFMQTFIGNTIIIREVQQEEKLEKHVQGHIHDDQVTLESVSKKIDELARKIEERG